ncbi:MAG TPA: SEC-C metal-binding domain-containing protein [bacterium]
MERLHTYNKVVNEADVPPLHTLRVLLELGGLLMRRGRRFRLTGRGEEVVLKGEWPWLFAHLFQVHFQHFNLAYLDGLPDYSLFQQTIATLLYRLAEEPPRWAAAVEYGEDLLLPAIRNEVAEPHLGWLLTSRLLEPLHDFGLVEVRPVPGEEARPFPRREYHKTPLLNAFLHFQLRDPGPPEELPPFLAKVGRNDPCPCGSGTKYKKCCGQPSKRATPEPAALPPLPDRRAMERTSAAIARALAEQEFQDLDEANAYLQGLLGPGGKVPETAPRTSLEAAQELIYDTFADTTSAERRAIARQALDLSPDCADAYCVLAEEADTLAEARQHYAEGVAAGERALGKEAFAEHAGEFWGRLETRPYMRARQGLADCLRAEGLLPEAIAHYRELLRLNPNDNQGVRDPLLACLLETQDATGAGEILEHYAEDWAAGWRYGRALHAFVERGGDEASRSLLAEARRYNDYLHPYLLATEPLPPSPPHYGLGSPEEAVVFAAEQMMAWRAIPGALAWLARAVKRHPHATPGS